MASAQTARRKPMLKKILLTLIFALSLTGCDGVASEFIRGFNEAQNTSEDSLIVSKVSDGDTIWAGDGNKDIKIRLVGVDTPELAKFGNPAQFMAKEAKEFTYDLVYDKVIHLERDESNIDKYDRYLRYVWLEEPIRNPSLEDIRDKTLNGLLVKEGYAYAKAYEPDTKYRKYFEEIEKAAVKNEKGIWSKKKNRDEYKKENYKGSGSIKGNKNSKIYHLPGSRNYNSMKEENVVYFESEKEAKDAGFRPAK